MHSGTTCGHISVMPLTPEYACCWRMCTYMSILQEGDEERKRVRRDTKDIERLRALAAAQHQQEQHEQQQNHKETLEQQ